MTQKISDRLNRSVNTPSTMRVKTRALKAQADVETDLTEIAKPM
jgi:hypothetical protein